MSESKKIGELFVEFKLKNEATKKAKEGLEELGKTGTEAGEKIEKGISKTDRAFEGLKKSLQKVKTALLDVDGIASKINSFGNNLVATSVVSGLTAVAAGVAFVGEETARLDTIAKSAQKSGLGFEAYQRLSHVATLSGADIGQLSKGIGFLNVELEKIGRGAKTGPVVEALEELGLEAKYLSGVAPEEQLAMISDAMAKVPESADKARLAFKLMSEDGRQLVPLFNSGGDAIRDMSSAVGKVFSREELANAEAYQDSLANLKKSIQSVAGSAAASLAPLLTEIANSMDQWVNENRGVIDELLPRLRASFESLYNTLRKQDFLALFERISKLIALIVENFDLLIGLFAAAKTLTAISSVTAGLTSMGIAASTALGPIGLIAAAVAALIPLALRAGEALGDVLSKQHAVATAPRGGGTDLAAGGIYAPELQSKAGKQSEELLAAEAQTRKLQEEGVSGYRLKEAKRREAEARIRLRETQAQIDGVVKAAKAKEAEAKNVQEDIEAKEIDEAKAEAFEFGQFDKDVESVRQALGLKDGEEATGTKAKKLDRAISILAAGGTLEDAYKGLESKGGKGGGAGKKEPKSKVTDEDFIRAVRSGKSPGEVAKMVQDLARATPEAKDIRPTVAITFFNIENKFNIEGVGDPMAVSTNIVEMIKRELKKANARAGDALKSNAIL